MTDFTATSSQDIKIYGAGIAEEIIPPGWFISQYVQSTSASRHDGFSITAPKPSEDYLLAQLSRLDRWRHVAKHSRGEFVIWLLALLGGVYMLIASGVHFGLSIFSVVRAEIVTSAIGGSSRDAFDWYVGGLMGIGLLCSLGMIMWTRTESKISFGKESTRTIIGFVAGFLSCGKTR